MENIEDFFIIILTSFLIKVSILFFIKTTFFSEFELRIMYSFLFGVFIFTKFEGKNWIVKLINAFFVFVLTGADITIIFILLVYTTLILFFTRQEVNSNEKVL